MSRLGKKPVPVPANVKVAVSGQCVTIESGSQKLQFTHKPQVRVRFDAAAQQIVVERQGDERTARALHGTTRALLANMVQGVTVGFTKELEVVGVGWKAEVDKQKRLVLNVGYADARVLPIPPGLNVEVQQTRIKVSGPDRQMVGQFASQVRAQRPPEPYNGKGIKYSDERIVRKQGKAFVGGATS